MDDQSLKDLEPGFEQTDSAYLVSESHLGGNSIAHNDKVKSRKPRVLMFAPYSFPLSCAESVTAAKFIYAALKHDWQIDVIAFRGAQKWYPNDNVESWAPILPSIHFLGSSTFQTSGKKGYMLDAIRWVIQAAFLGFRLTKNNQYDVIFSRATPLFGHLPALILQKKTNIPWIANWSDPLPYNKSPAPYGKGPDAKLGVLEDVYLKLIFKRADCHTFPSERLRQYYDLYAPCKNYKSEVVPHIALNHFQTGTPLLMEKLTICFAGSLDFRPIDILFQGLKALYDQVSGKILFKFIVSNQKYVLDKADEYGVASLVTVSENKSYLETLTEMQNASIALIVEAQCDEGITLPTKISDIVQIGKPILSLSSREGVLHDLITLHGGGVVADNRNADSVTAALKTLYHAWQNGELQKKYGSEHLMRFLGEDVVMRKFNELIKRLRKQ